MEVVTIVTYRGYQTVIVYDEETSYGAGATPATAIKGKLQTFTLNQSNNLLRTLGLGEGRNETFVGWGNYECTWSMEYEVADFDFLQFAIGSKAGSGTTSAPNYLQEEEFIDYTVGADSGIKSFGMIVNSLDKSGGTHNKDEIFGMIINNLGITMTLGETVKISVDGFAKTVTSSTDTTSFTADTTKPWIFAQGSFSWNASTVGRVQSATINVVNNYDAEVGRELGDRTIVAAEPGLRKYDWTIVVKMTSTVATTLRDDFYGQADSPSSGIDPSEPTLRAIILQMQEGTGSGDRRAQILLSDCSINDISKPINIGENLVELTINGAAKIGTNDTTNKPIKWWTVT